MTSPNRVEVVVTAKEQGLKTTLDSVNREVKKIGDTTRAVLDVVAADFFQGAANAAKNFVTSTVHAASDLGESINAVNKTFGESAEQVQDWGEANANAVGLSRRAFNEAIIPLGALLKNTGLAMDVVSDKTIELTKRAADMGSVFNTDVADVLADINSGLRGESDPLEKYGVQLSEAAVSAEALAASGKKSVEQLTNQEKVTARINLILKQTASSAGDFADTTDGLANSARVASAQIEDAKAKIGEGLLPVLAKAASIGGDAAEGFGRLPDSVQKITLAVGLAAAGFVYFAPKVLAAKAAIGELRESIGSADTRMGRLARGAAIAAVSITAVQVAASSLGRSEARGVDETTKALNEFAESGQSTSEVLKHLDYDLGTTGTGGWAKFGNGVASVTESLTGLGSVFDESLEHARQRLASIDAALADMVRSGHAEEAERAFGAIAFRAAEQGVSIEDLKKALPGYADALAGVAKKSKDAADQTKETAESFNALGDALSGAKNPLDLINTAFDVLLGKDHAVIDFADAQAKLGDTMAKTANTTKLNTEAGRENREAVLAAVEANLKLFQANVQSGMTAEQAAQQYDVNTEALERQLRKAGFTAAQIEELIGKYRDLPSSVTTEIAMKGLESAIANLEETIRLVNGLPPRKVVTVEVREIFYGGGRGFTRGGEYRAGGAIGVHGAAVGGVHSGLVKVGEEGEEFARLPTGTTMYPHANTRQMQAMMMNSMMQGSGSVGGSLALRVAPGADSRLADFLHALQREGILEFVRS